MAQAYPDTIIINRFRAMPAFGHGEPKLDATGRQTTSDVVSLTGSRVDRAMQALAVAVAQLRAVAGDYGDAIDNVLGQTEDEISSAINTLDCALDEDEDARAERERAACRPLIRAGFYPASRAA